MTIPGLDSPFGERIEIPRETAYSLAADASGGGAGRSLRLPIGRELFAETM